MNIPLNWLGELIALPKDKSDLTDKLTSVGHMLDKVSVKDGQTILDLELRGNRADCYSVLGIAREVAAIYGGKVKKLEIVDGLKNVKKLNNSSLSVKTPYVKRATMVEITNVKIQKSPKWLSERVESYGIESVNNIVDLTNYIMIEMGEPMHAFDLDKVKGGLQIRLAKDGEKITTFQGSTLTLTKEDLVWSQGKDILSVAGAIGEKYHSISGSTKNVLLEAANYDRANIRRTVYRHSLLTDAGFRHEKDLDPNMVMFAIERFLYFVKKYNWGEYKNEAFDYYPKLVKPWKLTLNIDYLNRLSGLEIERSKAKNILKSLGFEILKETKENLDVLVPTYRTDVTLEEDLIEEVLRIYGYDKIPEKTLSLPIPKNVTPDYIIQEEHVKSAASAIGFSEAISLTFVAEDYLNLNIPEKAGEKVIKLQNPPSPDSAYLRVTLLPNLYAITKKAINQLGESSALFEVGKVYKKKSKEFIESRRLGLTYWEKETSSFTKFKSLILGIFEKLNLNEPVFEEVVSPLPLKQTYIITLNKNEAGFGGQIKNMYYAEIDLDKILGKSEKYIVKLWPKYPPQIEDLTFILPPKTMIGDVMDAIKTTDKTIAKTQLKDTYESSYTFRVWYQNPTHTLDNKEVEEIRAKITLNLKSKFSAEEKN